MEKPVDEPMRKLIEQGESIYQDDAAAAKEAIWEGLGLDTQKSVGMMSLRKWFWPTAAAILLLLLLGSIYQNRQRQLLHDASLAQVMKERNLIQDSLAFYRGAQYKLIARMQALKVFEDQQTTSAPAASQQIATLNKSNPVIIRHTDTVFLAAEPQLLTVERVVKDTVIIYKEIPPEVQTVATTESSRQKKGGNSVTFTFNRKKPITKPHRERARFAKIAKKLPQNSSKNSGMFVIAPK